jgi:hypothetical protein
MKTKLFFTGLLVAFFAFAMQAQTQNPPKAKKQQQTAVQGQFVDANNDGVCDNYNTIGKGKGKGNNGQGQGLRQGKRDGSGQGLRNGQGRRNGNGKGLNRRGNYVDANNNGICDRRETK